MGLAASVSSGADDQGQDRVLEIGSDRLDVQVITVPIDDAYWGAVHRSSASTVVSLDHAASWMRDAIQKKTEHYPASDRSHMVLLLDARHAGVLSLDTVCGHYLEQYGDPAENAGFASVWIVGPTERECVRLGSGRP